MISINVVIPSSILSVEPGLLLKTIRIHQVIRTCSIFRVNKLIIYRDPFTEKYEHYRYIILFSKIDKYLKTPPYLRRKIVSIDSDLKHVGILPPLRLHIYSASRRGVVGEKRLGYFTEGRCIDIGLNKCFELININECSYSNELITVEITSLEPPLVKCTSNGIYRGPVIEYSNSFKSVVEVVRSETEILIATSRRGVVPDPSVLRGLVNYKSVSVFFGAPRYGLYEIADREDVDLNKVFDYVWNTIPMQGVKTVRTEEALISTLAILNIVIHT